MSESESHRLYYGYANLLTRSWVEEIYIQAVARAIEVSKSLRQSAVSIEPREGSLDYPSAREELKTSNSGHACDNLDRLVTKFGKGLA